MKINVVVYGCDNTGKTTLCDQLIEFLNSNGVPAKKVKSLGVADFQKQVSFVSQQLADIKNEWEICIYDRFPIIEEEVCGTLLRNKNHFEKYPDFVNNVLKKISFFIHCDPGLETILNWGEREQMEGIKERAKDLNDLYAAYAAVHKIESRVIDYNFKTDNWLDIANLLYNYYTLIAR